MWVSVDAVGTRSSSRGAAVSVPDDDRDVSTVSAVMRGDERVNRPVCEGRESRGGRVRGLPEDERSVTCATSSNQYKEAEQRLAMSSKDAMLRNAKVQANDDLSECQIIRQGLRTEVQDKKQ